MGKKSPPPENGRVDTFETLNVTLNSLSFVLQELLSAYRADLKCARVAGWLGGWVAGWLGGWVGGWMV